MAKRNVDAWSQADRQGRPHRCRHRQRLGLRHHRQGLRPPAGARARLCRAGRQASPAMTRDVTEFIGQLRAWGRPSAGRRCGSPITPPARCSTASASSRSRASCCATPASRWSRCPRATCAAARPAPTTSCSRRSPPSCATARSTNIKRVRPDVVATGNIGCITQLASGMDIPIAHTVELLDWAYGGPVPRGLEALAEHVQDVPEAKPLLAVTVSATGHRATAARRSDLHAHRRAEGDQGPRVSRRHDARPACARRWSTATRCSWSTTPPRARASPTSDYERAGAKVLDTAAEVFAKADLIVKVKEPQPAECAMLREGQTLFTYLHLAPDPEQAKALMASGVTAIAYETVTSARGGLPLLAPMSEVAGRMAIQAGAHCLEMEQGGRGMLLGGVAGVAPAKVVVLGGGVVRRQRRAHGHRARGAGDRARHQRRPALRHRPAVRRRRQHHLLHAPGGRGLRARGRSRDRRRAGARRRGAQADHRAAGQAT